MTFVLVLSVALTLALALAFGAAIRHRRDPGAAPHAVRRWWTNRGWTWSRPTYLTVHLLAGMLVSVLMLALFAQVGDWVADGAAITRFDVQFDNWLHGMATPAGLRVARMLSLIGGPAAMSVLGITGAAVLALRRGERLLLAGWVCAIVGGGVLDWVLKVTFHRPRPMFADPFANGYGFSFPSGHSMGSAIGFGMLAYIIVRHLHREAWKVAVVTAAVLLTGAVGTSRLYLGVHFPSDVLGGFAAGVMWLGACISGLEIVRDHGASGAAPVGQSWARSQ